MRIEISKEDMVEQYNIWGMDLRKMDIMAYLSLLLRLRITEVKSVIGLIKCQLMLNWV